MSIGMVGRYQLMGYRIYGPQDVNGLWMITLWDLGQRWSGLITTDWVDFVG
ncbi:hypothetical protein HanRHA438_Chr11g0524281 [Helianthus annuus]|nr:hypothetical protein HanRHA438_Chr11g0524281 [Helianthus annuus]